MKLSEILPPSDLLRNIEGVEGGLRQRRRIGTLGWIGFLAASSIQVVTMIIDSDVWKALISFDFTVLTANWQYLLPLCIAVPLLLVAGWSRFWLQESEAPFRYTCSIDDFNPLETTEKVPSFAWFSHDLSEKLTRRIGRLSLLDQTKAAAGQAEEREGVRRESHIHISGHYGVREKPDGSLFVEVMPRVRIGPPGKPETLAHPVTFKLRTLRQNGSTTPSIDTKTYEQLLERIYSSVATEIYKQIEKDVEGKIELLPTRRFKAVALFYEAEDYARSNTLDAYDEALRLYDRAIRLFDPAWQAGSAYPFRRTMHSIRVRISSLRSAARRTASLIYEKAAHHEILCARAEIGYTNMLLYRRILAGISGRRLNPVFETRRVATRAVERLRTLPQDIDGQRQFLFSAYVTLALSWYYLGSQERGERYLRHAAELDPPGSERDPRYLFAKAVQTSQLRSRMQLLRRAVELDHRFEVAQFELAIAYESLWRSRPTLETNVADMVFREYAEVLRINPGNIGAWANLGYMHWLLDNVDDARDMFENGREYKAIKRETFVAELDYGRARIAAEQGNLIDAYRHYADAVSAHVAQGFSHVQEDFSAYLFRSIDETILNRYKQYRDRTQKNYEFWLGVRKKRLSIRGILDTLESNNADGAAGILAQFFRAVPAYLTTSEKQRIAAAFPDLSFEKTAHAIETGNKEGYAAVAREKDVAEILDSYIPTARMCKSVFAFVMDEFGQACHYYYLRSGDAERLDEARSVYHAAIDLNRNYVTPHFNLFRLGYRVEPKDPWEEQLKSLEEIKKTLDEVTRLEPTWPNGLLAMAELEAKIAHIQFERARELESQSESFRQRGIALKQQADLRGIQPQETTGPTTGLTASVQGGSGGTTGTGFMSPAVPKQDLFVSEFISFEETVRRRQEAADKEKRVRDLRNAALTNLKEALDGLRILLPHAWIEMNPTDLTGKGLKSLLQRSDVDWVKEFDDLQVRALFTWAKIVSLHKSEEAEQHALNLYLHLQQNFLTENFELHEEMLALLERMQQRRAAESAPGAPKMDEKLIRSCRDTLKRQIVQWFADDPGAYWILTHIQDDYIDDAAERVRMLIEAAILPDRSAYLYTWIGMRLLTNKANDKARDAFDKASVTNDYHILLDVAQGYLDTGDKQKAFQLYQRIGSSKNPEVQIELARFKLESGMFSECSRILEKVGNRLGQKTDRQFLMKLADLYYRIGDFKNALSVYEKIKGKVEPDFALELSRKLLQIEAWDDSIRILESVLKHRKPGKDEALSADALYELLADAYSKAGRSEKFADQLDHDPYFADSPDKKAGIYYRLGNMSKSNALFKDALEYYTRAVRTAPEVPLFHWALGEAAWHTGDPDTYIYRCLKAVELRRTHEADVYDTDFYFEYLAEAYFRAGDPDEFFKRAGKMPDFANTPERQARCRNRIGNLYFQSLAYDKAVTYYNRAIEISRSIPVYHCNLGRARGNLGDWSGMAESCKLAIQLRTQKSDDPYSLDYYYEFLAAALYKLARTEEILGMLGKGESTGMLPDQLAVVWNRLGNLHFEDRRFDEAIRCYRTALAYDEKNPVYHCNLGRACGENGDRYTMLDHCKRACTLYRISKRGESTLDYYLQFLAEAYFVNGMVADFDTELAELENSAEFTPQARAIVYNRLGNLYFRSTQFSSAAAYYELAVAASPGTPIYHCNLGLASGGLKDYERMIRHCGKAAELRKKTLSDDYELRYYYDYLGEAYTRNGQVDAFMALLETETDPALGNSQRARIVNYIGNVLTELGDRASAADYYRRAIAFDPAAPIYPCNLGVTLGELGDTPGMLEQCRSAVELRKLVQHDEYGEEFYVGYLIDAYSRTGKLDEIADSFSKDQSLVPDVSSRALIFNKTGNVYFEQQAWDRAIAMYSAAVELDGSRPVFLCNLGRAHGEKNDAGKMIEYCMQALRLRYTLEKDDYDYIYYYEFVFTAYRLSDKIEEFISIFQSEFEERERTESDREKIAGAVYNITGNYFFSVYRFDRALEFYKRSVARDPLEPVYLLNVARSYLELASFEEALSYARRAIELRRKRPVYPVDEKEFIATLTQAEAHTDGT